tara:strand:- start:505 stop:726 length:222 start_codon:yes stop_codon:yes gene_type:complete
VTAGKSACARITSPGILFFFIKRTCQQDLVMSQQMLQQDVSVRPLWHKPELSCEPMNDAQDNAGGNTDLGTLS